MDKTRNIPLEAVQAYWKSPLMRALKNSINPRHFLQEMKETYIFTAPPEWIEAALGCAEDKDILPMAIHTFLMDWEAPQVNP
jgi:hypothetical protein